HLVDGARQLGSLVRVGEIGGEENHARRRDAPERCLLVGTHLGPRQAHDQELAQPRFHSAHGASISRRSFLYRAYTCGGIVPSFTPASTAQPGSTICVQVLNRHAPASRISGKIDAVSCGLISPSDTLRTPGVSITWPPPGRG